MQPSAIESSDLHDADDRTISSFGQRVRQNLGYLAWLQAVVATLGSLYFSEIKGFPPCNLCWYQRIFMYPLVAILTVGIIRRDSAMRWYALPLSVGGWLIASYHCLLTYGVISAELAPCSAGVSCLARWINWYGFITIPLLAWVAFSIITVALLFVKPAKELDHE
ncbi:disulfide oxidoreductase [Herpetosiphon geysericola]|uniref:disulfide oxidoreductase n=1 Tax=Herpetosiphon geysericola TaxID=70996 RepID=UPI0009F9584C|nr:disulfide oxidoreductase [Herpetosiphon geysericola]